MNYLAHAYLSFSNPPILVGNMISDYVKGKTQYNYPKNIQTGIQLHRAIDAFTDVHEATHNIKKIFAPTYRLYSGAFADVCYDYFLANDKSIFATQHELMEFTQKTYAILKENATHFPDKFGIIFPYMVERNWLYNYQFNEGMQKSFAGLARRAKYIEETETAFELFLTNKNTIQQEYNTYFEELKSFSSIKLNELLSI